MIARLAQNIAQSLFPKPTYHSAYGGLWTDLSNARSVIHRKLKRRQIDAEMAEQLLFWIDQGYVIIPEAVPHEQIDALNDDLDRAWACQDRSHLVQTGHGSYVSPTEVNRYEPMQKLIDEFCHSEAARQVMFAPKITAFLRTVFDDDVLGFQSLSFEVGSTQRIHQDTAYVVCSEPMKLAAVWIAREDIVEGSGELEYYAGSHRLEDYAFSDPNRKHYDHERDGADMHRAFIDSLEERSEAMGLKRQQFYPKKGDALIWAADLAHGGARNIQDGRTRKSHVVHYCPHSVNPHYFNYAPDKAIKKGYADGCYFASAHFTV